MGRGGRGKSSRRTVGALVRRYRGGGSDGHGLAFDGDATGASHISDCGPSRNIVTSDSRPAEVPLRYQFGLWRGMDDRQTPVNLVKDRKYHPVLLSSVIVRLTEVLSSLGIPLMSRRTLDMPYRAG